METGWFSKKTIFPLTRRGGIQSQFFREEHPNIGVCHANMWLPRDAAKTLTQTAKTSFTLLPRLPTVPLCLFCVPFGLYSKGRWEEGGEGTQWLWKEMIHMKTLRDCSTIEMLRSIAIKRGNGLLNYPFPTMANHFNFHLNCPPTPRPTVERGQMGIYAWQRNAQISKARLQGTQKPACLRSTAQYKNC